MAAGQGCTRPLTCTVVLAIAVSACQSSSVGSGVEIVAPATSHGPTQPPAAVVRAYITAINQRDYLAAWAIYRPAATAERRTYASFAAGFDGTAHDAIDVLQATGSTVRIDLLAAQVNGTVREYAGTYTVHDGRITASDIIAVS
jgi:hypothetical protein